VLGTMDWGKLAKALTATLFIGLLTFHPIATHPAIAAFGKKQPARTETTQASKLAGKLTEVAPPPAIQELRQAFEDNKPQVTIQSPRPNEVLTDDTVSVQFQVKDLTLFKDKDLGLGPHLHVFLDNQPYQAVYDPSKPLILEKLSPGTHTIRAFASRPWHESFKNEGAYAQTTFHVYTKTGDNTPEPNLPLLTYSRPQATYGAEPIMLDFYLTNAPLHLVAQEDKKDEIADWRIRCTINGNSFVVDQWQPIYLKGFKPGKNWVQLEFLDENGHPVKNAFNNTARVITYEPGGKDTLSKLVRGDLSVESARGIVDVDYKPPVPTPSPSPTVTPETKPIPSPVPVAPVMKATPTPSPVAKPAPIAPPAPVNKPSPSPTPSVKKSPEVKPAPDVVVTPKPEKTPEAITPTPSPTPEAKPAKSPVKDLLGRFRKEKAEKPISVPVVKPSISPTPAPIKSPEPVAIPKAVEIVPKTDAMERPQPVETPKGELPKVELPKAAPPQVEVPKTITTPATPQPVTTPKPVVTPKVIVSPTPPPIKPEPASQSVKRPETDSGKAAKDAQTQVTEKADELRTKVSSQFDKLRDRLRQATTPKPAPKPTPPVILPKAAESTPVPTPAETPTTKFPVVSSPQTVAPTLERSPIPAPTVTPEAVVKAESAKTEPERPLTPAEQYYSRLRQNTPTP